MGWDATFYFPPATRRDDAEHFLSLLGYKRAPSDSILRKMSATGFYIPARSDPARLSEVTAIVYVDDKRTLVTDLRTNIWCTSRDTDLQNTTLRELKRYFGGYFVSDLGKNRYFRNSGPKREGVEAACYVASFRFLNSIVSLKVLTEWAQSDPQRNRALEREFPSPLNRGLIAANLGTIYLVSLIEELFKSIFIETIRASRGTLRLNQIGQIKPAFLDRAYQGQIELEEAIAESLSFQNADIIRQSFSKMPTTGFVSKFLGKPISAKSKIKWEDRLQEMFHRRHRLVHQAELDLTFSPEDLLKLINFCERMVQRLYRGLTKENNWPYEDPS